MKDNDKDETIIDFLTYQYNKHEIDLNNHLNEDDDQLKKPNESSRHLSKIPRTSIESNFPLKTKTQIVSNRAKNNEPIVIPSSRFVGRRTHNAASTSSLLSTSRNLKHLVGSIKPSYGDTSTINEINNKKSTNLQSEPIDNLLNKNRVSIKTSSLLHTTRLPHPPRQFTRISSCINTTESIQIHCRSSPSPIRSHVSRPFSPSTWAAIEATTSSSTPSMGRTTTTIATTSQPYINYNEQQTPEKNPHNNVTLSSISPTSEISPESHPHGTIRIHSNNLDLPLNRSVSSRSPSTEIRARKSHDAAGEAQRFRQLRNAASKEFTVERSDIRNDMFKYRDSNENYSVAKSSPQRSCLHVSESHYETQPLLSNDCLFRQVPIQIIGTPSSSLISGIDDVVQDVVTSKTSLKDCYKGTDESHVNHLPSASHYSSVKIKLSDIGDDDEISTVPSRQSRLPIERSPLQSPECFKSNTLCKHSCLSVVQNSHIVLPHKNNKKPFLNPMFQYFILFATFLVIGSGGFCLLEFLVEAEIVDQFIA